MNDSYPFPGPRRPALIQGLQFVLRPVEFFERCQRRYGDPFQVRLPGNGTVVMFSDPAAIRDIFTGDVETMQAGRANQFLRPILGARSLLLLDGAPHRAERRMMLPPFHGERMLAYGTRMRDVASAAIERWPLSQPFPVLEETQAITLEVIVQTVFGVVDPGRGAKLADRLRRFMTMAVSPLLLWKPMQVELGPLTPWSRFVRVRREIDAMLDDEITRRRRHEAEPGDDILSLLLAARDEDGAPMPDAALRDELMTLLLAGHETTATALAWTLHRVLSEPGWYDRLRAELRAVTGGRPPQASEAARLPLLDAVIKETLRLDPVLPDVLRILGSPTRIGGVDLPAGIGVAPNIYATHRRPEIWPEPERFHPERFLGARPSPYEFIPFGGGVRRCLGMAFAMHELRVVMATILARTHLELAPGYRLRVVRRSVTWAPSDGMPVVMTRRAA